MEPRGHLHEHSGRVANENAVDVRNEEQVLEARRGRKKEHVGAYEREYVKERDQNVVVAHHFGFYSLSQAYAYVQYVGDKAYVYYDEARVVDDFVRRSVQILYGHLLIV